MLQGHPFFPQHSLLGFQDTEFSCFSLLFFSLLLAPFFPGPVSLELLKSPFTHTHAVISPNVSLKKLISAADFQMYKPSLGLSSKACSSIQLFSDVATWMTNTYLKPICPAPNSQICLAHGPSTSVHGSPTLSGTQATPWIHHCFLILSSTSGPLTNLLVLV